MEKNNKGNNGGVDNRGNAESNGVKNKKKRMNQFRTFRGYQIINQKSDKLTPSIEDYLEMIYRHSEATGYTRISQLSKLLSVQAPSVTRTVQRLAKVGLVDYEKYGLVRLTSKGKAAGEVLLKRHMLIEEFLGKIGIVDALLKDTEMIEHNLSIEALENIELFNSFLDDNPHILRAYTDYRMS